MRKLETFQVGVAVAIVVVATLACKPKSSAPDAGPTTTTTTTATATMVETADTASPSASASAKPTVTTTTTTTTTIKPTSSTTVGTAKATYKVGDAVSVKWKGSNYPATVISVGPNDQYKIHYTDYAASWDETVGLDRISGAAPPKPAGDAGAAAAPKDAGTAGAACTGPTQTRCNGVCVNIQTDDKNCGGCGKACRTGTHCNIAMQCRDGAGNL